MNYQALLAKYNFLNYIKFEAFTDSLPQHDQALFQVPLEEGKLVARMALQLAVDAADTSSRARAMAIVMHRVSYLHFSGFPRELQNTIEYLPFD